MRREFSLSQHHVWSWHAQPAFFYHSYFQYIPRPPLDISYIHVTLGSPGAKLDKGDLHRPVTLYAESYHDMTVWHCIKIHLEGSLWR